MHEIIRLGLIDEEFIRDRTSNFDALAETVKDYPPERGEQITGVSAEQIRRVARAWGEAAPGSSTGGWASRSTRRAPTTRAA